MTGADAMQTAPQPGEPAGALAAGLARHMQSWSLRLGAGAAAAEAAAAAARALVLAEAAGQVCLPADQVPPRALLMASHCVGTPGRPGTCPMVLDHKGRLYLHRHWALEGRLAERLRAALRAAPLPVPAAAAATLARLFPAAGETGGLDAQRLAVALALCRRLVLISGGPGTGKTHVAALLIEALLDAQPDLRLALAAPTGKAAARLGEVMRARQEASPTRSTSTRPGPAWPKRAHTLHRLLGAGPRGFEHDASRPLPLDLLVVDEASMLDPALAVALLEALPSTARLVLLGDRDQLSAVEAGAVFAELCAPPAFTPDTAAVLAPLCDIAASALPAAGDDDTLADASVWLERSRRFGDGSAIARAAAAVRQGQPLALLEAVDGEALRWLAEPGPEPAAIWQAIEQGYAPYLQQLQRDPADAAAAWSAFARFRVLCAVREGARGTLAVNQRMSGALARAGHGALGQPLMVLRNDPALELFNGDTGLLLPAPGGRLDVVFPGADGALRRLPPERLPAHELAWACTVHKAQGSEFDRVLLLLPATPVRVSGRELLYTGLTRARVQVLLCAPQAVLEAAIARPSPRGSGLADRLRGDVPGEGSG